MGVGIFPVFNPNVANAEFDTDGKVLASEFEALDELSTTLGIRLFSSFGDNRPVPDGFDGDPDELYDVMGEFDEWYSASDGIAAFSALAKTIRDDQIAAKLFREPEFVIDELKCLVSCLKVAESAKANFHLELW